MWCPDWGVVVAFEFASSLRGSTRHCREPDSYGAMRTCSTQCEKSMRPCDDVQLSPGLVKIDKARASVLASAWLMVDG